jgi:nicotinate-nucleotide pyrophosphorylase (carboxylating)
MVRTALAEDIGEGDATTLAIAPKGVVVNARLVARERCVVAGLQIVEAVLSETSSNAALSIHVEDGEVCEADQCLAEISGEARGILTAERTLLNYLQRLSGIATMTSHYVAAVRGTSARILDTRKTTPGWRHLEKYAVRAGGGENHRFGLYDRIMIKDNHRLIAALEGPGGITRAVKACRRQYPILEVEVEADSLDEVKEALEVQADYVLLDNMTCQQMRKAHELRKEIYQQCLLEASGGITLGRVPEVAVTGVDYISAGALTHSSPAIDIGLDFCMPVQSA